MERAVTRPAPNRVALVRAAWIAAILAAFLASERQTLVHFWRIWEAPDTYYSHGPLVPILAVLMARMNHARLRQSPVAPSRLAVLFAAAAAILHVFGAATGFEELSGLAFLLAVFAVILCLRGLRAARVLLWPVLFLVTMIPLPQIALDSITARYQILSSFVAAQVLRMAAVFRKGRLRESLGENRPDLGADSVEFGNVAAVPNDAVGQQSGEHHRHQRQ